MNPKKPTYKYLHNRKYLKKKRKNLRNSGTPAEAILWTYLKKRQLGGCKFRRQHSIGNFILDFYCHEKRLAIELDGNVHNSLNGHLQDVTRDEWLAQQGIKVLRFENKLIFQDLNRVLEEILESLHR